MDALVEDIKAAVQEMGAQDRINGDNHFAVATLEI